MSHPVDFPGKNVQSPLNINQYTSFHRQTRKLEKVSFLKVSLQAVYTLAVYLIDHQLEKKIILNLIPTVQMICSYISNVDSSFICIMTFRTLYLLLL